MSAARAAAAIVTGALVLSLSGCGGDGDGDGEGTSELEKAQAKVTAKEKALDDAEAEFDEKSQQFCDASQDYVLALDRYGDLITTTAPTVGDVVEAGADLDDPRDAAESGAEDAVEAHQAVLDAKHELADAKAELQEVKNPGSASSSPPAETKEPKPLVPSATVTRVEQAEAELRAVQRGISEDTPLAQASQQFNAAVVALEMAWLRLFSDGGCLDDEQQEEAEAAVRAYTTALQQSLSDAGYYSAEVDGVYGPATVDAVESLQEAHGLPVTGTVDKATAEALENDLAAETGATAQDAAVATAAVQQTLKLAGFWDGPVDGEWTPALTDALKDFQTELGVKPTGTVDAATVAALEEAIAQAQSEPSESPSSESPDESSSPSSEESGGASATATSSS
jgi:murein L,D-transpeptidase YcbB/YkuD